MFVHHVQADNPWKNYYVKYFQVKTHAQTVREIHDLNIGL